MPLSRRRFFAFTAGAGAIAAAQEAPHPKAPGPGTQWDPRMGVADADKLFQYSDRRPKVALVKGDNRRKNVFNALVGIDDQIQPGLKRKKYVLVKVNGLAQGGISVQPTWIVCMASWTTWLRASRVRW